MKKTILLIGGFLSVLVFSGFSQNTALSNQNQQILNLLEEEKLANEIYVALYQKWQHPAFQNISRAEQHHLELMKQLALDRHLTIPVAVTNLQTGVFENTNLQQLYDQLLADGNQSLVEALKVGAKIEETDIRDLKAAMAGTDDAQIIQTYTNLIRASENHLRAFHRNLDGLGVSYAPVALAAEDYQAVLAGKNSCTGDCCKNSSGVKNAECKKGAGKGKNKGKGAGNCCSSQ